MPSPDAGPEAGRKSCWLHELPWTTVDTYLQHEDIVLVPIGATEQHGPHLPLMVDTGWAIALAEGAARRTGTLAAPPLHYGMSTHHLGYPGTISLAPETLTAIAVDISLSLILHGFRKILLINGNRVANLPALDLAAGKVRTRTGAYVAVIDAGLIAKREIYELCQGDLGHAGVSETAMALHRFPELVDLSKAPAVPAREETPAFSNLHPQIEPPFDANTYFLWPTPDEFRRQTEATQGVGADPSRATAELGARICEALADSLARFIEENVRPATVEIVSREMPI